MTSPLIKMLLFLVFIEYLTLKKSNIFNIFSFALSYTEEEYGINYCLPACWPIFGLSQNVWNCKNKTMLCNITVPCCSFTVVYKPSIFTRGPDNVNI